MVAKRLLTVVVLTAVTCTGFWLFKKIQWESGESARAVRCASNMRQIGMALRAYADANEGNYPDEFSKVLRDLDGTAELVCPSSDDAPASHATTQATFGLQDEHCSYRYLGKGLTISAAAETPLLCEKQLHHKVADSRRMNVLYADGHVSEVLEKDAAKFLVPRPQQTTSVIFWVIPLVAFLAGLINAIAGGGTFFTFPALTGLGGLSEKVANMTSTIGIWPGAAASVVAARPEFKRLPRQMTIWFSVISIFGAVIGSLLLLITSQQTFKLLVPWLLLFATVIFGFSKPIARWAGRQHGHRTIGWTIIVAAVQLVVAIYGGYFGAGIGILMLAGLAFAGLDDIHQMNAMKVLLQTTINGVASLIFLFNPLVDWRLAIPMGIMSAAGGFLGIAIARRAPQMLLRIMILTIGFGLTAAYFVKAYR